MFASLESKAKAFAVIADTCGTDEVIMSDDIQNYLRVIAAYVTV